MNTDPAPVPVLDPRGLSQAQQAGGACAVCRKAWPLPDVVVGRLPDGRDLYACPDCAGLRWGVPLVRSQAARHGPRTRLRYLARPFGRLVRHPAARHAAH